MLPTSMVYLPVYGKGIGTAPTEPPEPEHPLPNNALVLRSDFGNLNAFYTLFQGAHFTLRN